MTSLQITHTRNSSYMHALSLKAKRKFQINQSHPNMTNTNKMKGHCFVSNNRVLKTHASDQSLPANPARSTNKTQFQVLPFVLSIYKAPRMKNNFKLIRATILLLPKKSRIQKQRNQDGTSNRGARSPLCCHCWGYITG